MSRPPGLSVRLKLTFSYAGFLMLAGALLLSVVWVFLLRYVPVDAAWTGQSGFMPGRHDLERAFLPRAVWALVFLLVLGLVGGWFLAGRMLAPLKRITNVSRQVAAGNLSRRIELEGHQDEFRELADSFDAMLARLEADIAAQRRFAANASHELRTPLAVTQTMLEVAQADPSPDVTELVERLLLINARAIDLTEALLLLSRSEQRSFSRELVDLSLIAEEAIETLAPLAASHGVAIETHGEIALSTGSPALLSQMAMNLVHNAIVHNLPERGWLNLTTVSRPASVMLRVENTGQALSQPLVATLTEPFRRGTDRVRADHAGVGLGLAIVRSITEAHGGRLAIAPRHGGGLSVTVELPSAGRAGTGRTGA